MGKLSKINSILQKFGFQLNKYNVSNNALLRRKAYIEKCGVDLIIDVGANVGQYGLDSRKLGFTGRICSFEPLSMAFLILANRAKNDFNWEVYNYALGEKQEELEINVSGNSHSSSILNIKDLHTNAEPSSTYIGSEKIKVNKLDSIFDSIKKDCNEIYLKIDTQGYESFVLAGAQNSLKKINTIQLEMSIQPLYQGQMMFDELYNNLRNQGYTLVALETGFINEKTGEMLQVDGIFRKIN